MFHNHFAVHGKRTTWQDVSNCRIRKDWKRSCSSHAILWCDGKKLWRFEVQVLYNVLSLEAVWPNGCTSFWYMLHTLWYGLDNPKFNISLPFFFFCLVFIFQTFKVIRMNLLLILSVIGPSRQVMRMNDLISLQVVFSSQDSWRGRRANQLSCIEFKSK